MFTVLPLPSPLRSERWAPEAALCRRGRLQLNPLSQSRDLTRRTSADNICTSAQSELSRICSPTSCILQRNRAPDTYLRYVSHTPLCRRTEQKSPQWCSCRGNACALEPSRADLRPRPWVQQSQRSELNTVDSSAWMPRKEQEQDVPNRNEEKECVDSRRTGSFPWHNHRYFLELRGFVHKQVVWNVDPGRSADGPEGESWCNSYVSSRQPLTPRPVRPQTLANTRVCKTRCLHPLSQPDLSDLWPCSRTNPSLWARARLWCCCTWDMDDQAGFVVSPSLWVTINDGPAAFLLLVDLNRSHFSK